MRSTTLVLILIFLFFLAVISFTFASGFGGKTAPSEGISCDSGTLLRVGFRYPLPFWFGDEAPRIGKAILGIYKGTNYSVCYIKINDDKIYVPVYNVTKFNGGR